MSKGKDEFYVVAWADYEADGGYLTSGTLSGLFGTYKKARDEVQRLLEAVCDDVLDGYDRKDAIETFGTASAKELAKKSIVSERDGFIIAKNPDSDIEYQYSIKKFSTRFIL